MTLPNMTLNNPLTLRRVLFIIAILLWQTSPVNAQTPPSESAEDEISAPAIGAEEDEAEAGDGGDSEEGFDLGELGEGDEDLELEVVEEGEGE